MFSVTLLVCSVSHVRVILLSSNTYLFETRYSKVYFLYCHTTLQAAHPFLTQKIVSAGPTHYPGRGTTHHPNPLKLKLLILVLMRILGVQGGKILISFISYLRVKMTLTAKINESVERAS